MSEPLEFPLINVNGSIIPAAEGALSFSNRSFLFGDGIFETLRISQMQPLFLADHFERLWHGADFLGLRMPKNQDELREEINLLISANKIIEGRMRITFFRKEGGYYTPENDNAAYQISATLLTTPAFHFNEKGLQVGIHPYLKKSFSTLSEIKSTSALHYVVAARHGNMNGWNDTILLNEAGNLCETASSNLFVVLPEKKILTPQLGEGLLPGVFRKNLLRCLTEHSIEVSETTLAPDILLQAEELFTCNSIKGIQWVMSFGKKRYFAGFTRTLAQKMNEWTQERYRTINSALDYPES
jgi:branched-chain amino acid aminotransferase